MRNLLAIVFAAALVLAAVLVVYFAATTQRETHARGEEIWYCSMHPDFQRPSPGKCGICKMDLILMESGGAAGPREFTADETRLALMDVQVRPVVRKALTVEVRLVGKVAYDEKRVADITAWVPGRLEKLHVDYTGVPVKKGHHMVRLYSPQLLAAQAELLQAKNAVKELARGDIPIMKDNARAMVDAAREKLRLWGLKPEQIAEIEKRGTAVDQVDINAPMSGIVIHKHVQEGQYVKTGTRIYTIADLTKVWVLLDAYESDPKWLRYGQEVSFEVEAYPNEKFPGVISLIDPSVDPRTRTVSIRVTVGNKEGKLKPGMFVRGVVNAAVAAGGHVIDPDLAGKWICYMHPEIVKDAAGFCDICRMPLVSTATLGYAPVAKGKAVLPLVIPASAPLITGKRAVVYVRKKDADGRILFEGRDVVLGPRAGDDYIVHSGLREGEQVVVEGNFKIDSALQIRNKPSMMSPDAVGVTHAPARRFDTPEAFQKQLSAVWQRYLGLVAALADDDFTAAVGAAGKMRDALAAVDMRLVEGDAHLAWMKTLGALRASLDRMTKERDIAGVRKDLPLLSAELASAVRSFGISTAGPVYRLHCTMAFNGRGAAWLQNVTTVRNPYYGAAMLECGDVTDTLIPAAAAEEPLHE